jgi:hypothetical protein
LNGTRKFLFRLATKEEVNNSGERYRFPLLPHIPGVSLGGGLGSFQESSALMRNERSKRAARVRPSADGQRERLVYLSIGFASPDPAKTSYDDNGVRILREINLYELSLCCLPANPLAVVTSVKSLAQVERLMQDIRSKAAPQDAETMAHLQAIHEHVLSLLGIEDDDPEDDDDPDFSDEDDAKALLAELKELTTFATK